MEAVYSSSSAMGETGEFLTVEQIMRKDRTQNTSRHTLRLSCTKKETASKQQTTLETRTQTNTRHTRHHSANNCGSGRRKLQGVCSSRAGEQRLPPRVWG